MNSVDGIMITGTSPKCAISCNDHLLRHQAGIIHKPNNCVTVISDHANNDDEYDDDDARPLMALRRTYMVADDSDAVVRLVYNSGLMPKQVVVTTNSAFW